MLPRFDLYSAILDRANWLICYFSLYSFFFIETFNFVRSIRFYLSQSYLVRMPHFLIYLAFTLSLIFNTTKIWLLGMMLYSIIFVIKFIQILVKIINTHFKIANAKIYFSNHAEFLQKILCYRFKVFSLVNWYYFVKALVMWRGLGASSPSSVRNKHAPLFYEYIFTQYLLLEIKKRLKLHY